MGGRSALLGFGELLKVQAGGLGHDGSKALLCNFKRTILNTIVILSHQSQMIPSSNILLFFWTSTSTLLKEEKYWEFGNVVLPSPAHSHLAAGHKWHSTSSHRYPSLRLTGYKSPGYTNPRDIDAIYMLGSSHLADSA